MQKLTSTIPTNHKTISTILKWARNFSYFCYFNPQQTENYPYGTFPHKLAVGNQKISFKGKDHFSQLNQYLKINSEQKLYGYFSYDLKNELEQLESNNEEHIHWDLMGFFEPECIVHFNTGFIVIESNQSDFYQKTILELIKKEESMVEPPYKKQVTSVLAYTSKKEYLKTILQLKKHILEGDIYEINYCINFSANTANFDPIKEFFKLSEKSPTPFASLLKWENKYILCASPERFIKFNAGKIISQPIKGTAKRSDDPQEDHQLRSALATSEKERAENMMIVDLVRNDLAKSALAGSVKVEEFFGIYSFKQVHQMISTIAASAKEHISSVDIIRNAFPMGSMTGAPKIRSMQLIEQYENTKRNVFSGSIGYFNGRQSFDFNVVIRSIFYDSVSGKLHYQVGGAITHDSVAEEEYEECLLKAQAIEQILKD